jgi:hypothetical protein
MAAEIGASRKFQRNVNRLSALPPVLDEW